MLNGLLKVARVLLVLGYVLFISLLLHFFRFQVIALNSSLEAEGELYIDDGKSYEFQQGAYIHRRFIFSGGKLTSINIGGAKSGKKEFFTDCNIERIILLGHPSQPKGALVKPSNDRVDVEPGPLFLRRGAKPFAAVIRNPEVQIGQDWTIEVL
uniref:DUF5110 domain-containing protein n=1 Tax=Nymphaea colorata TaxID=210225 RepID=A0A5K0Z2R1_9MAGN